VDLLKVDTDGLDFEILRSARETLRASRPAVFFELDPLSWHQHAEEPKAAFSFLADLGYRRFSFFTGAGFFYADLSGPQLAEVERLVLAATARIGIDNLYFDVLAADDEICAKTIESVCAETASLRVSRAPWIALQPCFWEAAR
jgi:hypothetical protein